LRALDELAQGYCRTQYAQRLLPWVEQEHATIQGHINAGRIFF
jgi:hypothetical protein